MSRSSLARDHLANERTFLAWVRTAFGGLALGIAVERFGQDGNSEHHIVLAAVLVAASFALLVAATVRYYRVGTCLDRGEYHMNAAGPVVVVIGLVSVVFVALLLGQ